MNAITLDEIRSYADALDGKELATNAQEKPFTLSVKPNGLEYTPSSSGMPRLQEWRYIESCLARFNETHSFHPADYLELTRNASYFLTLLRHYTTSKGW